MQKIKANISLGFPTSSRDNKFRAHLTIHDRTSGMGIVDLQLDAEQFGHLLRGSYLSEVDAEVAEQKFFSRVGKTREHKQVKMDSRHFGKGPTEEMISWGKAQIAEHGYEEGHWQHYNWGWGFNMERWVEGAEV
jgi:hypothetical protein